MLVTSDTDVTREGKGRARPGPSPSARTHSRRQRHAGSRRPALVAALGFLVVLIATAASSVFGTQAHQYSSAEALALLAAAGAFAGVLVVFGLPRMRFGGLTDWLVPLLAGAAGLALAPWIVMSNRYTDAPPGSEVLFFTVVMWGAMLAISLGAVSSERVSRIGGTLLAAAGAAALLANWERPSSFSPLVRYAREELLMLVAGVLWVVLVLVLRRAAARGVLASSALIASLGGLATAGALAAVGLARGTLSAADFGGGGPVAYGIAVGFAVAGMLVALRAGSAEAVAGAYLLVPATVSLIVIIEWAVGPLGPQPMILPAVYGGAAATLAGLAVLWGGRRTAGPCAAWRGRRAVVRIVATVVALSAVALAVVAFALPAMTASVTGLRTDGSDFRASFELFGYETAAAWIAFGIALAALGLALERRRLALTWPRGLALGIATAGWWFARLTPLRTLTSFIPSDVQVDYGSEFARIDFAGEPSVLVVMAIAGALLAVTVTWAGCAGAHNEDADAREAE